MEISVSSQTIAFLLSCLLGAGLAAVYDVFRILRIALPQPAPVIAAQDFAYLLICAGATFFYLMTTVSGQIRLFVLVGEVIGWVLYYFTIGDVVMKAAHTVIDFVYRLLRLLLTPFIFVGKRLYRILSRAGKKVEARAKKISTNGKMRLKQQRLLLYNLIKIPGRKTRIVKGGDSQ